MGLLRQFSVFLRNQPGSLARVCGEIARARVNIFGLCAIEGADQSVVRLVVDDSGQARSILKKLGLPFAESQVLSVQIGNQPGALAELSRRLARAGVNIEYAYGSAGKNTSEALILLFVSDQMKALRILEQFEADWKLGPHRNAPRDAGDVRPHTFRAVRR